MEMPAEARRCPVRGCENEKEPQQVVCPACWTKIPAPEKTELHKAWARRKALMTKEDRFVHPDLLRVVIDRHDAARQAAIAAAERGGGA